MTLCTTKINIMAQSIMTVIKMKDTIMAFSKMTLAIALMCITNSALGIRTQNAE